MKLPTSVNPDHPALAHLIVGVDQATGEIEVLGVMDHPPSEEQVKALLKLNTGYHLLHYVRTAWQPGDVR